MWSRAFSRPWSWPRTWRQWSPSQGSIAVRTGERSRPWAFQWSTASAVSRLDGADGFVEAAETELGEVFADLLGDELEEVHDVVGLTGVALAQGRVLDGHADGAGVEVADAHHDAAGDDEGRGREAVFLGAQEGGDDDVASGLHLAVGLDDDAVAQAVEQQGLLGLGQADLPGGAGVLEGGQRRGAGTSVVAGDEDDVGVGLGHADGDGAHARFGDQLDVDPCGGVGVLEVMDELGEVLDGVDVVVGRRGDEPDTGGGVPGAGDPRVDLVSGQLSAFAGFGALGHLALDVVGVGEVVGGDAETAGGDLFDGAAPQVPVGVAGEAVGVLSPFAGVGLAAEAVHGDREGFVGLRGDGAVGHGAGGEALDDVGDRFDLFDRDRLPDSVLEAQEPAQGHELLGLIIDLVRVLLEDLVGTGLRGVLEFEDGLGVEEVRFALAAPLVLAADLEASVGARVDGVGAAVADGDLFGEETDLGTALLTHEVVVDGSGEQQ